MQATEKGSNFWNFLKNPTTISQVTGKPGTQATAAGDEPALLHKQETLVVPAEASMHGGDPIFILLPQTRRLQANCRYCLVYDGSRRRHLASCEITFAAKALFSRVPEHDSAEKVQLSIFEDSQLLESLDFAFSPDQLLPVARDLIDAFPLVPQSLRSLRREPQQPPQPQQPVLPLDTDRRLCAALRKLEHRRPKRLPAGRCESYAAEQYLAELSEQSGTRRTDAYTVFHCLAESGWLESLAHLLRLTGQPESWLALSGGAESGGRTVLQQVRDRRFHSVLSCSLRLRAWLDQLDGQASRIQGQEGAVVKVRSWQTPAGSALIIMTTNKEKADTPLEQDLAIFPTLEAEHMEDHYLLKSPQTQDPGSYGEPTSVKETACAQTEIGKSIEDLMEPAPDSDAALAVTAAAVVTPIDPRRQFAETDSLVVDLTGEMSMSHSMSQSVIFPDRLQSPNSPPPLVGAHQPSLQQNSQQQLLLATSSRSVSTPTLYADVLSKQHREPLTPVTAQQSTTTARVWKQSDSLERQRPFNDELESLSLAMSANVSTDDAFSRLTSAFGP